MSALTACRGICRLAFGAFALVMLAVPLASIGCAGSSEYMREVHAPGAIVAPSDKAAVVFVRPSGLGFAINFAILDQNGNWVGDAVAKSHFAVSLPPGEYLFVGWAEDTAALRAAVVAGRTYFVRVDPAMGFASAHVNLEAVTPQSADWKTLSAWMVETKRLEPLPSGVEYIRGRHADAMKRVTSAKENWEEYSPEEKDERTLRPEDGVPSPGEIRGVALRPPSSP